MKNIFIFLFIFISSNCFGDLNPTEFQQFYKEYTNSQEKQTLGWSEIVFALEKNYNDDIIIFCQNKFGLYDLTYKSKIIKKNSNVEAEEFKNIIITCIVKNRPETLKYILEKTTPIQINASEYTKKNTHPVNAKVKERKILHIAIEDSDNSLNFLQILCGYGA